MRRTAAAEEERRRRRLRRRRRRRGDAGTAFPLGDRRQGRETADGDDAAGRVEETADRRGLRRREEVRRECIESVGAVRERAGGEGGGTDDIIPCYETLFDEMAAALLLFVPLLISNRSASISISLHCPNITKLLPSAPEPTVL